MIFRFEQIFDRRLIRETMLHPRLFDSIRDDQSPTAEEFHVELSGSCFIGVYDDWGAYFGLFGLRPQTGVCWELHCCLLPSAWGRTTVISRQFLEWALANLPLKRIVAAVPDFNRLAMKLAHNSGMLEYGYNARSFEKDGVLHGMTLFATDHEIIEASANVIP